MTNNGKPSFDIRPSSFLSEHVPHTSHGVQQARLVVLFKLLSQVANVNLNNVALAAEVVVPHPVEDHFASEHLSRVAHKLFEQFVFFGGQVDGPFASEG